MQESNHMTNKHQNWCTLSNGLHVTLRSSSKHRHPETCICSSYGHHLLLFKISIQRQKRRLELGSEKASGVEEILPARLRFCLLVIVLLNFSIRAKSVFPISKALGFGGVSKLINILLLPYIIVWTQTLLLWINAWSVATSVAGRNPKSWALNLMIGS